MVKRLIKVDDWDTFFKEHIYNRCFRNDYEQGYTDALDRVDDWMDTQPTVEGWIPVSERLPDEFGEYIVTVKSLEGRLYSDYADYDLFQKRWTTGLYRCPKEEVTHWMPLPEPPKEV